MVGGVIGSALWALLRRWELNGSGWYEIVTDSVFEKRGIMAWVHAPSYRFLFFGFYRQFCVYSQKSDPISIKFPSESTTIDERIFQTLGKKGIERGRIEKGVLKFRLELNLGDIVDLVVLLKPCVN